MATKQMTRETAVGKRMRDALTQAGLTQTEAAKLAGVDRGVVHKAVTRGSIPRDAETRNAVASTLKTTSSWLWFGASETAPRSNEPSERAYEVAGFNAVGFRPDQSGYVLTVEHANYGPLASKGDWLWVTPSFPAREGDKVYVGFTNGEEGLFRLEHEGDELILLGTPHGTQRRVSNDEVRWCHKVSGVVFD